MCGIVSILQIGERGISPAVVNAMTAVVEHRGPDGSGVTFLRTQPNHAVVDVPTTTNWNVGLGHRRLSILDLSIAGKQPMQYGDSLWITYNGEVYNFLELREQLSKLGHSFRSHSDTEVILASYKEWGTDCFERFRGMWGLVIIDLRRRIAVVSRDRLGIKPLYIFRQPDCVAIVSEIKQLTALPGFQAIAKPESLWEYLLTGDEESHRTFFEGVETVTPGTSFSVDLASGKTTTPVSYWFPERIGVSIHDPGEADRQFRAEVEESMKLHLRSDVPVGCALSGGLDSSTLAACATSQLPAENGRLHTFSVVFPGHPRDESYFVKLVADRIHAISHPITPTPEGLEADLSRFVWIHDEPVGGLAQYASYVVARLMREHRVPVTLNGQGGDEILGGYWQSYFVHMRQQAVSHRYLNVAAHLVGSLMPGGNPEFARQVPVMWRRYRHRRAAGSRWKVKGAASDAHGEVSRKLNRVLGATEQDRRLYEIREVFLPRLLKWDDRNLMAFGIEGRYPLLDHRVIETALTFAPEVLYSRGWTKQPMRRSFADLLPREVVHRRTKFGFPTPQVEWVFGPLRPMLEGFVREDSPLWAIIEPAQVRNFAEQVWKDRGRTENLAFELFRLFLIDKWMREFSVAA